MAETKQVNAGTKLESIGTVKTVVGEVKAVDAAGNERILQAGDRVFANETIVTANGGMVLIEFADGTHLDLASASKIVLDTDVFNPANAAPKEGELTAEQIQEMIARGEDPTAVTEATAAGAGAGDEGGSSFIVVDYNNTQGNVTSGFNTVGIPGPESTTFTELPPVEDTAAPAANPVPTTGETVIAVDEDDLNSFRGEESLLSFWNFWRGNNDTAPGDDLPPGSPTFVTGTLNASFGGDGAGDITFNAAGTQPALTSGGQQIQYLVEDNGHLLIGYVGNLDSENAQPIFFAHIDDPATGAFTFVLVGPLDHADPTIEDNLLVNLGYTIQDSGGDPATGVLSVNIDDDSPVIGFTGSGGDFVQSENAYVPTVFADEDDLKPGNGDNAVGDENPYSPETGYSGPYAWLPISFGADGPAAENPVVLSAAGVTDQNGNVLTLTSGNQPLSYQWDAETQTLTAFAGETPVFTVTVEYVDQYGAEVSFQLLAPLDHQGGEGQPLEDNLIFNLSYTATDGDGDSVTGILAINVDDDSPVAGADSAVVFAGGSVTIDVTANDSVGADGPGTWSNGGSYTFDASGKEPGVYNDSYTLTDADNDQTTGNISVQVLGRPVVNFTDGETNVDSLVVDEDGSVTVHFQAQAQAGSHLAAVVVTGFNPAMSYDFSALGTEGDDYTFDGTTLTILNVSGNLFEGSFEVTPPADSDVDVGTLTATATAAANADSGVTADSSNSVDVYTDAVADAPVIDISVTDGPDGNDTFQANESGTVTVSATFGDSADGSETHSVTVSIPVGFTVTDVVGGTYTPGTGGTGGSVTYDNVGAALNTTFTVTNVSSPDGTVSFSGTATATETSFSGQEPDTLDNTASDDDSASVGVSSVPTPSVTLAGVEGDTVWLKEDGSAGTVNISASTNDGSQITSLTVTGFVSGFTYNFDALGTEGSDWTFDGSTLTLLNLSGTSFSGSFTVTPATQDSDADLGTLTANIVATSTTDSSVTNTDSDTVLVNTDAVLDQGVDVVQTAIPEQNESASAQLVGLNLDATAIAPFIGSGNGGNDADTSESVTATVTLTAGVLYAGGVEQTATGGEYTFTGTADQVVTWLESLQVQVPAGFDGDGSISGTVSILATDTPTDTENTTADNSYASNGGNVLNFIVSVDSVPVANDDSAVVFTGQTVTINLAANDAVGDDAPGTWTEGGTGGTNYSFSATGDNAAPGIYNDSYTLSDSDGDSDDANIVVTVLGGPSVTLGASAGGDTVWLKEDGSAQSVDLSATAATGSHLSQIVITGLQAGFTYNFSGLDTDGAGGITVDTSVAGQVTISGLSGTSYNGSFTVTPSTADSDADLGTLNAQVTVAADANSAVTTTANDSVIIKTDAVLDQFGDVAASAPSAVAESASAQTVALGLSMNLANAGFPQSLGAAGADTDGSETFGVTITISAGTLSLAAGAPAGAAVNYDGAKWVLTADTPANLAAAVSYLQVTVAANFDGTITGTINSTAIDTATDSENTTADNSRNDSANFSLTVTDGAPTNPSNDSITVEEESIPGIGGNNESDGLSYQVTNGDFSNNASWGPDGFGGIVSVDGVTANGFGHIIIDNATYTLDVVAATGAYTFTLKDNVNSGAVQGENTTSLPTFTVVAQDGGDHDQITFNLNVSIVDDVPVSSNDYGKVTVNSNGQGSTSGNVVTNDSFGADGAGSVTSVTFNGVSYNVSAGGTLIHGTYGDLTIKSSGAYSYVYTGQPSNTPITVNPGTLNGATVTAYDQTSVTNPDGSLNLTANPDAAVDIHGGAGANKQGFGVDGANGASTIDFGEQLVVKLGEPIQGSFTFQIGEYNANQSDLGDMSWAVFGVDGHLIDSGTFAELGGSATQNGTYTGAPISFNEQVGYIVFGMSDTTGSGYTVTNISYVDTSYPTGIDKFGYTIADSDGDTSSSSLYLTSDQYLNDAVAGGHTLTGGVGDDILVGNDGNDILIGGAGNDVLSGGTGADTFVWKLGNSGTDTVIDFTKGAGGDVLNLADLLQGETAANIETGGFLQSVTYSGGNTTLVFDSNGSTSGGTTQTIVLQGVDLTNGGALSTPQQVIHQLLLDQNIKTDAN